jgi:ankyrin repeat protein
VKTKLCSPFRVNANPHSLTHSVFLVVDEDAITVMRSPENQIFDSITLGDFLSFSSVLNKYPLSCQIVNWEGQSTLHIASKAGNLEMVRRLLDLGADPNSADKLGMTPLMEACSIGHLDLIKTLVDSNADIRAVSLNRQTPLWFATLHGSVDVVIYLLDELQIDPNAAREDGVTPLMVASSQGFDTIAKLLINAGSDVNAPDLQNTTALVNAAEYGSPELVSLLLRSGAHVNIFTENSFTPLIVASAHGHLECVQRLVEAGAIVDLEHPDGVTALMYASAAGHVNIVKYLIASGSDVNARHNLGGTALLEITAAPLSSQNTDQIVRALLDAGALVNIADNEGITPIISASAIGHETLLRYSIPHCSPSIFPWVFLTLSRVLIDAGADLNLRAHSGMTALHYAISMGHSSVLQILLQGGANPRLEVLSNDETHHGTPSLIFAVETGNLEIVRLLVENISEKDLLNQGDEHGITPLLKAIRLKHFEITEYLLSQNVNPNDSYLEQVSIAAELGLLLM